MDRLFSSRWAVAGAALAVFVGLLAPLAFTGEAAAHPLGNFTINRYARIELYRNEAVIHYVLDLAEIPTFQLKAEIDADGDSVMSPDELNAFSGTLAERVRGGLALSVGPDVVGIRAEASSATAAEGQGGLHVLRFAFVFRGDVHADGPAAVQFSDENYSGGAGWREIVIDPSPGTVLEADSRLFADRSDALRSYPEGGTIPADEQATFSWDPGTGSSAPGEIAAESGANAVRTDGLSSLLQSDRSPGIILLSLLVAFGFGALHALGPGHGKSVVAAYLVGSRGTPRHALGLGLTVTATHTAAVYGLGLVTLVASDLVAPEHMFLYLGVVSGALIVLMGGFLLVSRVRGVLRPRDVEEVHRHGLFGAKHSHLPTEHDHAHAHAPARASGGWYRQPARWNAAPGHVHEHGHDARVAAETAGPASNVTWRGLVTLGIAGGLIPCPSALVVMLAAISLGQVLFGMALIVAFSFGLAGVLVAIGMALVLGRRLSGRRASRIVQRPIVAWALTALPIVSAAAVTLAGIAITYQAWNQPGI